MKQYKIKLNNLLKKIGFFEIFLTFLFLTMLFFLIFYLFRSKEWIIVDIKITSDNVIYENRTSPFWLTSSLKKGDTEYDGLGKPIVEILDIKTYDTDNQYPMYYKEAYVKAKIQAVYSKTQKKYTHNSKDVLVGAPISIKPNGILLEGLVTKIEGVSDKNNDVHKKVLLQIEDNYYERKDTVGVRPWIADAINVGDQIKGFNGETIAKVLDKKVEPAIRITTDNAGNAHSVRDPYLQDLYITLDLVATVDHGNYYYRNTDKIKVGNQIFLFTPRLDTKATIIDILN
ncbi:MAG: hypothetical protein A2857_02250 [Candidatus Levybacteria bacterium RIFCSPHIGHO2_01_FULL_36_15]|nr:MAG: hypothetical protein A2857_02250 [Candidatus Levybacteria bacterium RIFCSPHIGHO2_01_FULL_36_15]